MKYDHVTDPKDKSVLEAIHPAEVLNQELCMTLYSHCTNLFTNSSDPKAVILWTQSSYEKHLQIQREACLTMFECLESGDYIQFANALDLFWSTHM